MSADLALRLRRILLRLEEATHPRAADAPGLRLHVAKLDNPSAFIALHDLERSGIP